MEAIGSGKPIEILLVEDEPSDVRLAEIALREAKVTNKLHVVYDGGAALDFLFQRGSYESAPRPDLILLDLMIPKVPGHDVLREVKESDKLKDISVVVLTSSADDKDLLESYNLKADCFLTKPFNFKQLLWVVDLIDSFGLSIVRLDN